MSDINQRLGAALKTARKAAGYSLARLGRDIDWSSKQCVLYAERGRRKFDLASIVDRAEIIGVRPSELVRNAE